MTVPLDCDAAAILQLWTLCKGVRLINRDLMKLLMGGFNQWPPPCRLPDLRGPQVCGHRQHSGGPVPRRHLPHCLLVPHHQRPPGALRLYITAQSWQVPLPVILSAISSPEASQDAMSLVLLPHEVGIVDEGRLVPRRTSCWTSLPVHGLPPCGLCCPLFPSLWDHRQLARVGLTCPGAGRRHH